MGQPSPARSAELAENYARILRRIQDLSPAGADRRPPGQGVELVTVTKFFPAQDVLALYRAGVRSVGENRVQEAAAKAAELEGLLAPEDSQPLEWHCIGQVQTNKAKSVARWATSVHSVDRTSLVQALDRGYALATSRWENEDGPRPAGHAHGGIECLVQVRLGGDASSVPGQAAAGKRAGAAPEDLPELAEQIVASPGLRLGGIMAVAPLGQDPADAFRELWELSQQLQESWPQAQVVSAGMSADMAEAIHWGSTRVRVGSAILGDRPRPA